MNDQTLTALHSWARGIILGLAVITVIDAVQDLADWLAGRAGQPGRNSDSIGDR
ncbi:hypothetical protein [Nocardia panacis]|uniref:hypothetical protein n=1 Tax=Nocardia panacis TaxID=2340916 RepID=UPI00131587F3|nr:hypothetical protein [Nocardia panacis]